METGMTKAKIVSMALSIFLMGCASQSAMPLGNDMMQIDVSAAPVYGRAGAQKMAFEKAARATLDSGYDKFIIVDNAGWNEDQSSGNFGGNQYGFGGSFNKLRAPEVKMIIKMFHTGDKGSEKAIDAHKVLEAKKK